MVKTFYNKTTGDPAVFDDNANLSDWSNFQETQPDITALKALTIRAKRDKLLAESDSKVWPDHVLDQWRTYRSALRDVPAQSGFPTSVTWPVEPS